jgi:D-ribose pyranase
MEAGRPTVDEVVELLARELRVERFHIADEAADHIDGRLAGIAAILPDAAGVRIPHAELKALATTARAVIRTGDCRAFANVLLVSGVIY